jgi:hypothetical protein
MSADELESKMKELKAKIAIAELKRGLLEDELRDVKRKLLAVRTKEMNDLVAFKEQLDRNVWRQEVERAANVAVLNDLQKAALGPNYSHD